ncbi:MAG: helix-turn-helix transcriptional regulator [Candidatus Acidiferrales bacterium]
MRAAYAALLRETNSTVRQEVARFDLIDGCFHELAKLPGLLDWIAVGRRIRGLRGFDMTQADFASRIGMSQSYLSAVEHGCNKIGAEVLLAFSREFDKSLEWLLTGVE